VNGDEPQNGLSLVLSEIFLYSPNILRFSSGIATPVRESFRMAEKSARGGVFYVDGGGSCRCGRAGD
jgi:hypothetical protein